MSNTNLTTFTFKTTDRVSERWGAVGYLQHDIRVVTIDGEPWFVAKDVCECLGLALHNGSVSHHLRALDTSEISSTSDMEVTINGSGMARAKLISECGLYKLGLRSDKPEAKVFQNWVTKDVLPAIRKDGAYVMGEEKLKTGGSE